MGFYRREIASNAFEIKRHCRGGSAYVLKPKQYHIKIGGYCFSASYLSTFQIKKCNLLINNQLFVDLV